MSDEQTHRQGEEAALRERARQVVQSGTLPNRRPDGAWGGHGVGADCAICGMPVKLDELEFEIEFVGRGDDSGRDTYHVHIRCFAAWEIERDEASVPRVNGSSRQKHEREPLVDRRDQ
jgi:hypothetical protein